MNKFLILGLVLFIFVLGAAVLTLSPGKEKESYVLGAENSFTSLSSNEFNQKLNSGKYELIDVRTSDEYNDGHLKNAVNNDFYQTVAFSKYLDSLDKSKSYLIYCRTGHRSGNALKIMQAKGFSNVNDLSGGYNAWVSSGLPIEK